MVSSSEPGCDWLHPSLAQGPCSVVGLFVAASGLQKSAPAYEPCQQPAPATCLVVKPILNHQALPPTPSKGEARRIAKPPATIDNHRKLPSKLVCTRFCRAFRAASRQITPDLASFCPFFHFACQPFSLLPLLLRIPPHRNRIRNRNRAHQAFPSLTARSHRIAKQTCQKRPPASNPEPRSPYTATFVNATRPFCASQPRLYPRPSGPSSSRDRTTQTRSSAPPSQRAPAYF